MCIKHGHEMERKYSMRQPHGSGGMEEVEHSHALHGNEWSEECLQHDVKRKEKHRDSVAVIS